MRVKQTSNVLVDTERCSRSSHCEEYSESFDGASAMRSLLYLSLIIFFFEVVTCLAAVSSPVSIAVFIQGAFAWAQREHRLAATSRQADCLCKVCGMGSVLLRQFSRYSAQHGFPGLHGIASTLQAVAISACVAHWCQLPLSFCSCCVEAVDHPGHLMLPESQYLKGLLFYLL